jgi:hypothetical protein
LALVCTEAKHKPALTGSQHIAVIAAGSQVRRTWRDPCRHDGR